MNRLIVITFMIVAIVIVENDKWDEYYMENYTTELYDCGLDKN